MPTNPHQISSIKKDPMLEEELFARLLECIFLISFTLYDFRMGRQTPLQPHHPPSACGVRARRHFEDTEDGLWKGGKGCGRERRLVLWIRDVLFERCPTVQHKAK